MAFYYLHEAGTPPPKDEKEFKYMVYSEYPIDKNIDLNGTYYCPHKIMEVPKWDAEDEIIDIVNKHSKSIVAQFKKKSDVLGFTIWERI